MNNKKVIIIGAGMGGLTAGTYLQMNGYDTTIFEMNGTAGGLCTSWERKNYKVDLCIHWLVGSGPGSSFYHRWNELINMEDIQFVNHDEYFRMEDGHDNFISVFADIDRMEHEFITKAPEDEKEIRRFIGGVRNFLTLDLIPGTPDEIANIWEKMKVTWKLLPYVRSFNTFVRYTCRDYSKKFKNPLLRKTIEYLFDPEMSIVFAMMALTWFHKRTAGYPVGGSLNFATKVYDRYNELGGHIQFGSRVVKILTENNKAIGVQLENGERYMADHIISAADGYATIFNMLDGRYTDKKLVKFYDTAKTFPSLVFIALGIRNTFAGLPRSIFFPATKPVYVDPESTVPDIGLYIHNFDPTLAPAGSTLVTCMLETRNYAYWNKLHDETPALYKDEKKRIADELIENLERHFGNIKENVEMVDVSTPVTFSNYSGNWKGSFEGWLLTPETGFRSLSHTLPGLSDFYMCGQWVAIGGGLPGVLSSGRDTAEIICYKDKIPFSVTSYEKERVAAIA